METGPAAALEAMTAPTTQARDADHHGEGLRGHGGRRRTRRRLPTSAPALIALALAHRRRAGQAPPILASLDNLLDNGNVLRGTRPRRGRQDRPVPRGMDRPRGALPQLGGGPDGAGAHRTGSGGHRRRSGPDRPGRRAARNDTAPGSSGPSDGLAPLADVGVELVDDVAPFERRKLWLLNGPHSAVAYGGLLAGHDTIAGAVADPAIARFVRRLVDDTLEVAEFPAALQPAAFADEALRRFANPTLGHTCAQVGADGSSKLPQRLLPVVAARRERALDTRGSPSWPPSGSRRPPASRSAGATAPTGGPRSRATLRAVAGTAPTCAGSATSRSVRTSDPRSWPRWRRALARLTTEGPALLGGGAVTATLGGRRREPRARGSAMPSCARRSPGSTSTGAHCAWSSPTAPGTARCPCSCGPSRTASAGGPAAVHRRGRARHPCADDRRRHRRTRRSGVDADPKPRLVGGRHVRARGNAAGGARRASCPGHGLHDAIDVRVNRLVVESDVTLMVGPVLPHEVIGFSGGNKYLFPGLSGEEMIDVTHWLGALITSSEIIGTRGITPVRALVDAAAELVPGERHALCVVVDHETGGLESLSFGEPGAGVGRRGRRRGRDAHRVPRRARSSGCSRWSRRGTRTSGRAPRASTRSSRSSPTEARSSCTPRTSPRSPPCTRGLLGDRLPLPRLLPGPVGPLPRRPAGRAGALHPPLRGRDLRPGGGGTPTRAGDARHRHPRGRRATGRTSATSRPRRSTSRRVGRRSGHAGRARRRRGALPPPVRPSPRRSFARVDHAELGPDGVERRGQRDGLVEGDHRALRPPVGEAPVHLVDLEAEPVPLVGGVDRARRRRGRTP